MLNTYTAIAVNPEAPFTDADGNADLILVHSKSQEGRISIVSHLSFS